MSRRQNKKQKRRARDDGAYIPDPRGLSAAGNRPTLRADKAPRQELPSSPSSPSAATRDAMDATNATTAQAGARGVLAPATALNRQQTAMPEASASAQPNAVHRELLGTAASADEHRALEDFANREYMQLLPFLRLTTWSDRAPPAPPHNSSRNVGNRAPVAQMAAVPVPPVTAPASAATQGPSSGPSQPPAPPPKPGANKEKLDSNVLNYLVWRYLQERGFAKTAYMMCIEWHSNPEHVLPFAKDVKEHELIHLCQDGLLLDDMKAKGDRDRHKYNYGDDHGPLAARPTWHEYVRNYTAGTNGTLARQTNATETDARASRGSRVTNRHQLNGDVRMVDTGVDSEVAVSDAASTSNNVEEPWVETLAIGTSRAVNTEMSMDLSSNASFIELHTEVDHALWDTTNPNSLLVAGDSMARCYEIDSQQIPPSGVETTYEDAEIVIDDKYSVTAACWLSDENFAVSIMMESDTDVENGGSPHISGKLYYFQDWGMDSSVLTALSGTTYVLEFNPASNLLLALSTGTNTEINVFEIVQDSIREYKAHIVSSNDLLYGAVWISHRKFIACGSNRVQIFEIVDEETLTKPITNGHLSPQDAFDQNQRYVKALSSMGMDGDWFVIKYNGACDVAAFVDEDHRNLRHLKISDWSMGTLQFEPDEALTSFQFKPSTSNSSTSTTLPTAPAPSGSVVSTPNSCILVTTHRNGDVRLYDVLSRSVSGSSPPLHVLHVPRFAPFASAFSPDGALVAAAGFDTVAIWTVDEKRGGGGPVAPRAVWRCEDPERWPGARVARTEDVQCMAWGGDKVVFSMGKKAVVIRVNMAELK